MNTSIERLYYQLPIVLQHVVVSMYGFKLYQERYAGEAEEFLKSLRLWESLDTNGMQALQEALFVGLAQNAIKSVPYYQQWAKSEKLRASDITTLSCLNEFPVLEKEQILETPEQFLSLDFKKSRKLIRLNTSGTSGTPLTIFTDRKSRTLHYAFFSRLRQWFGLKPHSKRATFFGRIIMLPEQQESPFWRYDLAQNNLLMSSYHLAERNLPSYYDKLKSYAPEEIIGYPSSLYRIARYILDSDCEPLTPRVVITTAETLLYYQREALEKAFACPVVDQYGCTEMAFFASQCEYEVMHFHPEHGIVEILDHRGRLSNEGTGMLIATGLVNQTMPLIRYKVGDCVSIASQGTHCKCGRAFPIIQQVEGRLDDTLYQRNGTPVGRLDPVFKGGSGIREAQIIQGADGNVTVKIVPTDDFDVTHREWLIAQLQARLGRDINITVHLVPSIEKSSNGKFRAVKSEYQPQRRPAFDVHR